MNNQEAGQFLALTSMIDNRTITAEVAMTWAEMLKDITLADATTAMREHYRASREWLMPSDIVSRVQAMKKTRAIEPIQKSEYMHWVDCDVEGVAHVWCSDGSCALCEQRAY